VVDLTPKVVTTTANAAAITAIAAAVLHHAAMLRRSILSCHRESRLRARHVAKAYSRTARKPVLRVSRLCGVANPATGRIWIGMAMEWGANRGGSDAGVMLKKYQKKKPKRGLWSVIMHLAEKQSIPLASGAKEE